MQKFFIVVLLLVYVTFLKAGFALAPTPELRECELNGGKVVSVSDNQWYCDMSSQSYDPEKRACQVRGGRITLEQGLSDRWYCDISSQCPPGTVSSLGISCNCPNDVSKVVPLGSLPDQVSDICQDEVRRRGGNFNNSSCSAALKDVVESCPKAFDQYKRSCANEPPPQPNANENTARNGGSIEACRKSKQIAEEILKVYKDFSSNCNKIANNVTRKCPQITFNGNICPGYNFSNTDILKILNIVDNRQKEIQGVFNTLKPALDMNIKESNKCIAAFGKSEKFSKKAKEWLESEEFLNKASKEARKWLAKKDKDSSDELGGGSGIGYGSAYTEEQPNSTVSGKTDLSNNVFEDTYPGPRGSSYDSIDLGGSKPPPSKTNNGQIQRNTASPSGGNTNARLLGGDSANERKAKKTKRRVKLSARRIFDGYKNLKPYFADPNILVNEADRHTYGREQLTEKLEEAQNKLGTDVPLMFVDGSFVQTFLAEKAEEKRLERERLAEVKAKVERKMNGLAYNSRFYKASGLPYSININKEANIFRLVNLRYQKTLPNIASSFDYSFPLKEKKTEKKKKKNPKWWSLENILSFF